MVHCSHQITLSFVTYKTDKLIKNPKLICDIETGNGNISNVACKHNKDDNKQGTDN